MSYSLQGKGDTLKVGQAVFLLGYHDKQLRFPFVEPYVFLGKIPSSAGTSLRWCFQEAGQYLQSPVDLSGPLDGQGVWIADDEGLATLVDWPGLLGELNERFAPRR